MSVDITKAVRQILIKSWLDLGKIRIQVAGKTVIIRGRLVKNRDDDPVNGLFIEQIEQKIRGIKGLKQLRWTLDSWEFDRGEWRKKED
jgi:hypothetical protein